jgi:hypothetical protein
MAEESSKKALIMTAASTLIAVVVTGAVGWFTGVWNQGSEALARDQIEAVAREVIAKEMETDSGMSQAEALVMINATLVRIETTTNLNRDDIKDLRNAVQALAGD